MSNLVLVVLALLVLFPSILAAVAFGRLWVTAPLGCLYYVAVAGPSFMAMSVLAFVLSPALSLLSLVLGPVLPWPLSLFHTEDDDLDGGQRQVGWPAYDGLFDKWKGRMAWICRNPAYGWAGHVVALGSPKPVITVDEGVYDFETTLHSSPYRKRAGQIPLVRGKLGPLEVYFGWKLWRDPNASFARGRYPAALGIKFYRYREI